MLKRKVWIPCFLIISIILGGCSQKQPPTPTEAIVTEFSLGKGVLAEPKGEISFPLDGLLGIPAENNCPVVFLLHGAHAPEDITEDRYYRGFGYLTKALAEQGYLAVSINLNQAYSFEPFEGNENERALAIYQQFFALLQQANDGKPVFEYNLKNKGNLSSLNFLGHSRGGDNSLYIANYLIEQGSNVNSVLTVSSPMNGGEDLSKTDVPIGIILSQYDGEVIDLGSSKLFSNVYYHEDERKEPVTMAFLYGANHAKFNTEVPSEDFLAPPQNVTYLDGDTQRAFLVTYASDFFRCFNQDNQDLVALLGNEAPIRMGIDFMPSLILPNHDSILPQADMAGIITHEMKLSTAVLSNIPEKNTLAPFNPPGCLSQDTYFYRLSWKEPGATMEFTLDENHLTDKKYLSIYMANDSTAHSNSQPLALELQLTDKEGRTAAVTMDDNSSTALRYMEPAVENIFLGMENMPAYFLAAHHTPLGTQYFSLSDFKGVDLSSVQSLTIKGTSEKGNCILGGIRFE